MSRWQLHLSSSSTFQVFSDTLLPLVLDLRGVKAVVFGGGEVGLRKASYLAKEASVTVVSKDFAEGFDRLPVLKVAEDARSTFKGWVESCQLVVAATDDPALNHEIVAYAQMRGAWANSADAPSTFLVPSLVERRTFLVAATTLGRSPAMSKYIRHHLERTLPGSFDRMVDLQERLREWAKGAMPDQRGRERFLREVLEDESVWEALARDEEEALSMAKARGRGLG